ncbi:MAG: tRNA (adenosine(37)-N6)-threonylcarbamoyltransferase complex ATPase subunit type 1 TsaE [Actinobacteria bacterium]|nr:tRNA (adenosine(37)-N6)-threonylcarbamoyltransferase complex ATPase subunit type 1 TsaE [Actinomycetota bacterium]
MIEATTKSADDTRELAAQIAGLAKPGDLLLLAGDMGAGKTTFTQGFGKALGVSEQVTSPTFTLVRNYEARIPLLHVDAYRLESLQEVIDLGLHELLDEGAVALIEWGDIIAPVLPTDFLEIRMEFGAADDDRRLRLRCVGQPWAARMTLLGRALDRWSLA